MDCPACKDPLIVLEHDQVEVDHCLSCKGVWLDSGELELLLGGSCEKNDFLAVFQIDKDSKEKTRKCPICSRKMQKVLCGSENKIKIDRCPENDGLWFDLGELERIIRTGGFGKNKKILDWLKDIFGKTLV